MPLYRSTACISYRFRRGTARCVWASRHRGSAPRAPATRPPRRAPAPRNPSAVFPFRGTVPHPVLALWPWFSSSLKSTRTLPPPGAKNGSRTLLNRPTQCPHGIESAIDCRLPRLYFTGLAPTRFRNDSHRQSTMVLDLPSCGWSFRPCPHECDCSCRSWLYLPWCSSARPAHPAASRRLKAPNDELPIRLTVIAVRPRRRPDGRDPVLRQHGRRRDERSNVL